MAQSMIRFYLATADSLSSIQVESSLTVEELCGKICRRLEILPISQHLFALRIHGSHIFLAPNSTVDSGNAYDFRIRFKVSSPSRLKDLDLGAFNYYYHQVRKEVLNSKIPEIEYQKHKNQLVGLGVTDMYRVIKEGTRTYEDVTKDYKKFLPKEVNKKHWIFVKKPILKSLTKLQRAVYDPSYVKEAYLKQFHMMAPNYLAEEYGDVLYKFEGSFYNVVLHVMPFHEEQPGLRVYLDHKKEWIYLCSIEELCYMTAGNDGTLDISRKNGIPVYLKFMSLPQMFSFIGCCDGYYRLMVKSTFNICKIVPTPSLQRLHLMKCHGPVGGEFSYHKLIEKRGYKPGCYILRQCEQYYDVYYVDVFTKNSTKPETYKIEKCDGMYAFKEDPKNQHSSIAKLLSSYNNAEKRIFLQECLPPSEYDKSPLLLCGEYHRSIPSRIDNEEDLETLLSQNKNRRIISPDDLLLFKGQHSKSVSGDKCKKWNKSWNRRNIKTATGQIVKGEVFEDKRFPDPGRKYADRYCRNPDGDLGGPWCFVETDESDDIYEKEYCDIPFCDYQPCEVFTGESSDLYTHYLSFDSSVTNLKFALKMWSPDDLVKEVAIIALTVLSVPATHDNIEDWAMGLEVTISCDGIGLTIGNNRTDNYFQKRPNLLKVGAYTEFWLSWSDGELFIGMQNTALPIFKFPFQIHKLMSVLPLRYYSLKGKNLMWNAPFCDVEECPLHTTSSLDFAMHWPMKKNSPSYDIEFSLRAVRFAHLKLVSSPAVLYPRLVILLSSFNNFTKVVYEGSSSSSDHLVLAEVLLRNLLTYHKWITFTLTVFGSEVQVHRVHEYGTQLVIKATHSFLKKTRWFSCGSQGVIAHWSFFCKPPAVEPSLLPECVLTDTDKDYKGTQWVTSAGAPCMPWIAKTVLESKHDTSFLEERISAVNYCRNIKDDGPSCLIMSKKNKVIMSSCHVRLCTAVDCKMAGTADGYMGALSVTRSNLTCKDWLLVPENIFRRRLRNITLYADNDLSEIKNYCRNPTRSIAGPWCYTTHPNISVDFCNVRDCDLTEEQIVIMKPIESKRYMYILPEWKFNGSSGGLYFSLKLWNPDFMGGMGFSIYSKDLSEKYVLSIGAEENEKLILEYGKGDSLKTLSGLEYPRIVPTGKWVNLWLQVNRNGIRLGYQGMEDDFFSWEPRPRDSGFKPTYMTFYTLELNNIIGTRVDGEKGLTVMYKAEWKVAKGKKMEVAMKLIKQDACDKYKVEFNDLAGRWADLSSSAIVKLHGITLRSTTSMIMEYMRYGPLDVYLRDKCSEIVLVDLVEAAASLATALWHLAEAGIVHGDIRCRKLLVASHTDERFQVKLSDPGLHLSYAPEDVHWLPIECYSNPELAKKSASADVWAFATTLWEIFSYGDSPARINPTLTEKSYLQGHRLCIPKGCPPEMWSLVQSAWMADPHRRATPHTLMRDINHIFYQVFNSRRTHSYATVYPKSFKESSITTGSASSLGRFSNGTTESCLEAVLSVSDAERDSLHSISSTFSGGSTRTATTDQDNFHESDTMSCDISTILSNLQFSSMNSTNSLDPGSLFQCKFELDANCNLVLQGRIGQGFYGEVFRGTLETDGESEPRSVAVKKLKTTALSQMQDFEREIAIMKKLKHRNIVEILGVIEEPEIQLIMEYIWHGSLQSYLKIHRHAVTVKHLVGYALDVALGMDYLGTKHVVHRDLAARNILVVAEDHVKISDFGLAQVMSKGDYYIFKTNRDLPLKWYAPESVSDGKYSSRSDVWSYGVTLWEMFSYGEEPPSWGPNALIENTLIANSDSSSHLISASSVPDMEKASKLCCPAACPSEVYARLLLPCWNLAPYQRPTFKQLASICKEIAATLI